MNLIKALELDPDLASLPRDKLANIFQMLYICSRCDYDSYFSGLRKAAFNVFFQHASFINVTQMQRSLSDVSDETRDMGFMAFIRLIGTLLFQEILLSNGFPRGCRDSSTTA